MRERIDIKKLEAIISVAKGEKEADLILKNVNLINVFSSEINYDVDIAIYDKTIAGIGSYSYGKEILNLKGDFVSPALWDSHVHIESSMVTPFEFMKVILPKGTGTVVADPHEIANVSGVRGIKFMLETTKNLPLDFYFMVPSCVPATNLETSGAILEAEDIKTFLRNPRILGLAEMMNYPGVIYEDKKVLSKLVLYQDKTIDGHSPFLKGKDLNAYLSSGISSDHECTNYEEAFEKLQKGMWIMIREGSVTRDTLALLPLINDKTKHRILLATDDRHPEDLIKEGHINFILNLLIKNGINVIDAIRLATLNPAVYFGVRKSGGIAPSYSADIIAFKDLENIEPHLVIKSGRIVSKNGEYIGCNFKNSRTYGVKNTINLKTPTYEKLRVYANSLKDIRVIKIIPHQIVTNEIIVKPKIRDGQVISDTERDIIKIAIFERHKATGKVGVGFITGFKLKHGAFASSIGHDSHNIVAIGENDKDILLAVYEVQELGGGISLAKDGKILKSLALPYGGLMSDKSVIEIRNVLLKLNKIAKEILKVEIEDPFMTAAFMALPVVPALKITDLGLVDVINFKPVNIFIEQE